MATELCQKCKQSHPGLPCDYDDQGDCAETRDDSQAAEASDKESRTRKTRAEGK